MTGYNIRRLALFFCVVTWVLVIWAMMRYT